MFSELQLAAFKLCINSKVIRSVFMFRAIFTKINYDSIASEEGVIRILKGGAVGMSSKNWVVNKLNVNYLTSKIFKVTF
jgi:hypothetical protein